jgi:hypothetical protein
MRIGKPALGSEKRSSVVCKGEERRGEKSHTKLDFFYYSSKKKNHTPKHHAFLMFLLFLGRRYTMGALCTKRSVKFDLVCPKMTTLECRTGRCSLPLRDPKTDRRYRLFGTGTE